MSGFPVEEKKLMDIIYEEGIPEMDISGKLGYNYFVTSISFSIKCNDDDFVEMVYQLSDLRSLSMYNYLCGKRNIVYTIPFNKIIWGGMASDIKIGASSGVDVVGRGISVYKVIDSIRFPLMTTGKEDKVIYCLGDSIDVLSSYVTRTAGHRNYQALEIVRNAGYNARIASWAMSGNSMNQFVGYMKQGNGRIPHADVILVQHGANDIGQNITNSKFTENLNYLKLWRDVNFKGSKLVVVKVAPSSEGVAGGHDRNLIQEGYNLQIDNFVAANQGNEIYTIDVYSNVNKDGTLHADGVHLNQAGHDIMGPLLGNGLKSILGI